METIKTFLKDLIPPKLQWLIGLFLHRRIESIAQISFSQEAEDLLLSRYFGNKSNGFYVDVGAHHPTRFSNTYLFYTRGWRGINIDARPGLKKMFRKRKRDITVECGVGRTLGDLKFFQFAEPALSTFDESLAAERKAQGNPTVAETIVPVKPLSEIMREHLPPGTTVDFLTIDIEGHDLHALASNDWTTLSPRLVLVEILSRDVESSLHSEVSEFLRTKGYRMVSKLQHTCVFELSR